MKRLLITSLLLTSPFIVNAKVITLNIPDSDIAIVENDVENAEEWIRAAWAGKVNKCKERIVKAEIQLSISKGEALPAGETAIVQKYLTRPDYKNRVERDAAEDAKRIK